MYPTIEQYGFLKLGDFIKVKKSSIPPCKNGVLSVHSSFIKYINEFENLFTVRTIYTPLNGLIFIATHEVTEFLEKYQFYRILTSKSVKVFNI